MSMTYWMNEGIGIDIDNLYPHINHEKVIGVLEKLYPDEPNIRMDYEEDHDICMFCDQGDYAELLCKLDTRKIFCYGTDGDGAYYFLYSPRFPWEVTENDPKSIEEVHQYIIELVRQITDLSDSQIDKLIDNDIYEVGCG